VGPRLGDRVDDLVVKTNELVTTWATGSTRQNAQNDLVRLMWSAALRVRPDIFIQVFIEYVDFLPKFISIMYLVHRIGRSEYNHLPGLGSSDMYILC